MGYGLSETSGVTGQVANSWAELEPLLGSTGSVFGGTEIKVISIEDGKSEFGRLLLLGWLLTLSFSHSRSSRADGRDLHSVRAILLHLRRLR